MLSLSLYFTNGPVPLEFGDGGGLRIRVILTKLDNYFQNIQVTLTELISEGHISLSLSLSLCFSHKHTHKAPGTPH